MLHTLPKRTLWCDTETCANLYVYNIYMYIVVDINVATSLFYALYLRTLELDVARCLTFYTANTRLLIHCFLMIIVVNNLSKLYPDIHPRD